MFEHDDDRGFWDDEPTRPLQRLTARIKPAGAPPPPATRLWPSRANAGRHHDTSLDLVDDSTRRLPVQRRTTGPALFDHQDDPDLHEPQQGHDPHDPFADVDVDFDIDAVMWPDERRRQARGGTATMTRPAVRPEPQPFDDEIPAHDDNWPASVGEALLMAGRRTVQLVRDLTANMSPLARRIGVLVLMLLVCVPIAMSLRGGSDIAKGLMPKDATDNTTVAIGDTAVTTPAPSAVTTPAVVTPATAPAVAATPAAAAPTCSLSYKVVAGDYWISIAQRAGVSTKELLAANNATTKSVLLPGKSICLPAGATVPGAASTLKSSTASVAPAAVATTVKAASPAAVACGSKYTIVSGDAWSLIASRAKVSMTQLLSANNATTATVLLPGKSICLPAGASMPAPTTTVKATTTTVAASSGGGIVKTRAYSQAEVQTIIRQYWPAELQDWALKQAWKESNWQNNAYNWCCYGLFQINFSAHQSWLKNYGVTSASQLLDPVVNTKMAIIVYQRMGGYWPTGA